MSFTLNGVGSWYYGRNNVHNFVGQCEFCGTSTTLTSYDTTLYFVVIYLAICPLGRKRIINQCASCSKHRLMPLAAYNTFRDTAIDKLLKDYCAATENVEKATELIQATIHFRAAKPFQGVRVLMEQALPHNAPVQSLLGGACEFFGDRSSAETHYHASLSLDPSNTATREDFAVLLLKKGHVDEARQWLSHVLDSPSMDKRGYLYVMIEGLRVAGRHRESLEMLEAYAASLPAIHDDKEFKQYLKKSRRYTNSSKPLRSKLLAAQAASTYEGSPWNRRLPLLITAGIILLTITIIVLGNL